MTSQIQKIEAGQFLYNSTARPVQVVDLDRRDEQPGDPPPNGGSWTAIRVTLAVDAADVLHEGVRHHLDAHAGPSPPRSTARATWRSCST